MKFTEGCANKITVPPGKAEVVVFDDALPGFGIRKFQDGRAVYFVRYAMGGTRRKLQLSPCIPGVLVSMRKKAAEIIADSKRGHDPLAEKQATIKEQKDAAETERRAREHSFGTLINVYLAKREVELKARSIVEMERHLRRYCVSLHGVPVDSITRRELAPLIDQIAEDNGRTSADRVKASLSSFFAWCLERDFVTSNPTIGIRRRADGGSRERVLSEQELAAIWRSCEDGGDYADIIKLLLLLGQRREEIGGLTWNEVDLDRREIRLPGERTKNGRAHVIPLSDAAMAILAAIPRRGKRALVFGRGEGGFSGWSKCKERLDERLGETVKPWRLHDLRRSFATWSAEHDFGPTNIIEAQLNHQSGSRAGIVKVYNLAAHERAKRVLVDRFGEHITGLVEGRQSNIVALRG